MTRRIAASQLAAVFIKLYGMLFILYALRDTLRGFSALVLFSGSPADPIFFIGLGSSFVLYLVLGLLILWKAGVIAVRLFPSDVDIPIAAGADDVLAVGIALMGLYMFVQAAAAVLPAFWSNVLNPQHGSSDRFVMTGEVGPGSPAILWDVCKIVIGLCLFLNSRTLTIRAFGLRNVGALDTDEAVEG